MQRSRCLAQGIAAGLALSAAACSGGGSGETGAPTPTPTIVPSPSPTPTPTPTPTPGGVSPAIPAVLQSRPGFYLGADLSYANWLQGPGCGVTYRVNGTVTDPFAIYRSYGANVVRVRLFVDPAPDTHGGLADATETIRRARAAGMQVLLDFHYSDIFADPDRQDMPAAWAGLAGTALADRIYTYSFDVLRGLDAQGLMPELVQVGNETNSNILRAAGAPGFPLDWARNAPLFNAGIRAVRDAGAGSAIRPKVVLHIAQPENVDWWFTEATANGVTGFDMIGVSYYPSYSTHSIATATALIPGWRSKFGKDVLFVETAYPFTFDYADATSNLLWTDALEPGFPATPEGQRDFMIALTQAVIDKGGKGAITWEPAWVSTPCRFAYGIGSSWENATNFDFRNANNVHAGIAWLSHAYVLP